MKAKLVVVGGDVKATEINLNLPVVIGRGREATLTLPHPLVSRKHCELYEVNGVLKVRDLGSLNGTYVGRERVDEAVLPHGELLTVATVNFRAEYESADEPTTDPPHDVADSESTYGLDRKADERAKHHTTHEDMPQPPSAPPSTSSPVERDTEWQMGNMPPRKSPPDFDDLSSLLNDSSG